MRLIALALVAAFALSGTALARDKYRGDTRQTSQPTRQAFGWDDGEAAAPKKVYQWPDQRYYGQHGMMLD